MEENIMMQDGITSLHKQNIRQVLTDENFTNLISEIKYIEKFIYHMDDINFNRSFYFDVKLKLLPVSIILDSARATLYSIQLCCENNNLADAYTLIRKYRDDLFFYLYIIYVNGNMDVFKESEMTKHEKNITEWNNNNLKNLNICEIVKYIGTTDVAKHAVKKYKLQQSFNNISEELNNFVHSNGKAYYNRPYMSYKNKEQTKNITENMKYQINYITSVFLFLLTLINPIYISSTDYIDSLEMGLEPEEGSQYFVAPFIIDYIDKKMVLIDEGWKAYLKENVEMDI